MTLPIGAILALFLSLVVSGCNNSPPAGDAVPPAGPAAIEGDY